MAVAGLTMPNRIIREGILTSARIAKLGWPEEVFYRRLLSVVDDFGRYYADVGLLRAACYPRQLSKVSDSDVGKWLQSIADAALVRVYQAEGEQYLEALDFGQQVRAKKSKFPDMPSTCVADAQQMPASAHLDVSVSVSVEKTPSPSAPRFAVFWKAYPKKVAKDAARKAFEKRDPDDALLSTMLDALHAQSRSEGWRKDGGQFIPHPSTWLNEGRWQDEGVVLPAEAPRPTFQADPPMTPAEREASDAVRRRVMEKRNHLRQIA